MLKGHGLRLGSRGFLQICRKTEARKWANLPVIQRQLFHSSLSLGNDPSNKDGNTTTEPTTIGFNFTPTRQTNYYTSLTGERYKSQASQANQDKSEEAPKVTEEKEKEDPGKEIEVRQQQAGDEEQEVLATHYFDTNKIYTGLRFSGFTEGQAEVIMRAMRDILTHNLDECKEESISQSGVDNEAYLFEAAASELRTDVQQLRETQAAEYSSNLARLQRDVEIAQQELNESLTMMKSGIDIELNERKNITRHEASLVDMKLQELNNRISIDIVSDIKSEIEALRWQTTRRGLSAVSFVLASVLVGIYVGRKTQKDEQLQQPVVAKGVEFAVPMLTSAEDEINYLEEKRFAVESLNELGGASSPSSSTSKEVK